MLIIHHSKFIILALMMALTSCSAVKYVPYYEPNITVRDSVSGYRADDGTLVEEHWHTETHVIEVDKPVPKFYRNSTIALFVMVAGIVLLTILFVTVRLVFR